MNDNKKITKIQNYLFNFLYDNFTKKDLLHIDKKFLYDDVKEFYGYNPTKNDIIWHISNNNETNYKKLTIYIKKLLNFIETEIIPFYKKEKKWKGETQIKLIKNIINERN